MNADLPRSEQHLASHNERALAVLRDDIVHARLLPGARLRVEELRSRYGLGATPLREALSRLAETGLVEAVAQRGFRVAPVSQEDLEDITDQRIRFETLALRSSMERRTLTWEADLVSSHHLLAKVEEALLERTGSAFDDYEHRNRTFHETLVANCGSKSTLRFQRQIYDLHERYRRISMHSAPHRSIDVRLEHRLIKEAAVAGDIDAACDHSVKHIMRTTHDLRHQLPVR